MVQTSPWLKKMPWATDLAAASRSGASANTTCGLLPPHSSQTRLRLDRPEYCSSFAPVAVEPVKASTSTSMCRASGSPTRAPWPGSTFSTPSGRPASAASAANRSAVRGDRSEGLSTTELPMASAGAIFQQAISSGKFHGTIAATTPSRLARDQPQHMQAGGCDFAVQLVHRFGGPAQAAHHSGQIDAARVAHRLAHVQGFQQRQRVRVFLHQGRQGQQHPLAVGRAGLRPVVNLEHAAPPAPHAPRPAHRSRQPLPVRGHRSG